MLDHMAIAQQQRAVTQVMQEQQARQDRAESLANAQLLVTILANRTEIEKSSLGQGITTRAERLLSMWINNLQQAKGSDDDDDA